MKILIKNISTLSDEAEKYILNILPTKEYGHINIENIINNFKKKFKYNINKSVVESIRSSFMKESIIKNFYKLNKFNNEIMYDYNTMNVLSLSKKYDLSPMSIMKSVINNKYKYSLMDVYTTKKKIEQYDYDQFNLAQQNDIYFVLDQSKQINESKKYEIKIEKFLKRNEIKFKTQEELTVEQYKLYKKAISTPDFLIESDLYINNVKINWIDAKNFYGANLHFIKSKLIKQSKKYIKLYGSGSYIFSLGFNEKLKINKNILLLSF